MFSAGNIQYEIADKDRGLAHGGIGGIQLLVKHIGLAAAINDNLKLLTTA